MVSSSGLFLFALFRGSPRRRPCGGGAILIFVFPLLPVIEAAQSSGDGLQFDRAALRLRNGGSAN
jgi:hypothetical protein